MAEFQTYIEANDAFIPNYGDRYRYGEVISTAWHSADRGDTRFRLSVS